MNTLKYVLKLEEAGVTRRQAEAEVQMVAEIVTQNFATKQDVNDVRRDIHSDFIHFKSEIKKEMIEFQSEIQREMMTFKLEMSHQLSGFKRDINHRFQQMEYRLTIKLGTIVSLAVGLAVTLSRLLANS